MADKKVKSNLSLEALLKLPNLTAGRVLQVNGSNETEVSAVTTAELAHVSGVTSAIQTQINDKINLSEKDVADGVATLNASGKIPTTQLPALAITEVFVVADIAARDALVVGPDDGEVQEGDVAIVLSDANGNRQPFIYDGTVWQSLDTTDFNTNLATKTTDDLDEGATNLYHTTKRSQDSVGNILSDDGIVDLTYDDITPQISAAINIPGATAETVVDDADLVLIYDSSATAHRKMTRADFLLGLDVGASAGDISETTFAFDNNISVAADVTGLSFAAATVRIFKVHLSVERGTTFEAFELLGIQLNGSFSMAQEAVGDDCGLAFTITTAGQVQYTSTDNVNGGNVKFRAITTTV